MKIKNRQLILSLFILGISVANVHAQIHQGNAYLKNDYIQMALSPGGVYGSNSSTIAPGYYSPVNTEGNGPLGFIASPNASWPNFYGDYILPGGPYEAFSLTFTDNNGIRRQYVNSRNAPGYQITALSPAFVYNSDILNGEYTDVTWYGQAGSFLQVECRFQLVGAKVVHYTTIRNISGTTLTNIYFARAMDPDQEAGFNSGELPPGCTTRFETYNIIESQADGTPGKPSWVAAYGYCTPAAIAYYCENPQSRVGISESWQDFLNNPEYAFGSSTSYYFVEEGEYSRTIAEDWSIEMVIFVGNLTPDEEVTLTHEMIVDQPPIVRFDNPLTLTKNEGETFTYNLTRQHQLEETVTATVRLSGISNAVAADFAGVTALPRDYTVVFGPGDTVKTLSIQAAYDCLNIDYKNFELEIVAVTSAMGGVMSPPSVVEGIIRNIPPNLPVINPITGTTQVCTGQTTQLYNTTAGGTWKSANAAVATISNGGQVSGVAVGTAAIWYIVTNGCTDSVSTTVTVIASVTPSISISASGNNICSGTDITYTATPTNGGASPVYQWKKNNAIIGGATGSTYTYAPADGDVITCVLTPDPGLCTNPATATSNSLTMSVTPVVTPSVTISAVPD